MRLIDADRLLGKLKKRRRHLSDDMQARRIPIYEQLIRTAESKHVSEVVEKMADECEPLKHGKWVNGCYCSPVMPETDMCSECGLRLVYGLNFNYCPNCGAKMDEEVSSAMKEGANNVSNR